MLVLSPDFGGIHPLVAKNVNKSRKKKKTFKEEAATRQMPHLHDQNKQPQRTA